MDISKKLKSLREHYLLTEVELAEIIGVTEDTIFDYESGKKIPDDLTLKKLANALFTTVSFFSDENKQIVSLSIERADGSYRTAVYEEPDEHKEDIEKLSDNLKRIIEKERIINNNFENHPERDYIKAHEHCTNNKKSLKKDKKCGCFFCLSIYNPAEITEWLPNENTALCPYCGVDSVIPESSGYKLDKFSLKIMHDFWFDTPVPKL